MSRAHLVVLTDWLVDNMLQGFIHESLSPFAARVPFAQQADGGLQFCVDFAIYRVGPLGTNVLGHMYRALYLFFEELRKEQSKWSSGPYT
jgi:hypothetical protein